MKRIWVCLALVVLSVGIFLNPQVNVTAQEDEAVKEFSWDEYGITLTIPGNWEARTGSQNYDLALVSPEALAGGSGSFIIWVYYPSLGQGATLQSAMETMLADMASTSELEPYTVAGIEGLHFIYNDTESNMNYDTILIPYGDQGGVFLITVSLPVEGEDLTTPILESTVIEPVKVDEAAVDAAWQTSLADSGKLLYGPADAPVRIFEILSYTCSHCANSSHATDRLLALEADPGHIQFEWGMINNNDFAGAASKAAYCATEQGKGYTAYKALWKGYFELGPEAAFTVDGIVGILDDIDGLDTDALKSCVESDKYDAALADINTRATEVGMTGTPSFLLASGDDPLDFMITPDGTDWSGEIPVYVLRGIISGVTEKGMTVQEAVNDLFGVDTTATPAAPEDDAQPSGTESADKSQVIPASNSGDTKTASTTQADEDDKESDDSRMIVVGGAVLLAGAAAVMVVVSRRQVPPATAESTADISTDDVLNETSDNDSDSSSDNN
ncbi:MAG TPA: thioredoxin domain-containing protein [Aggregatilineaceae bacterium]|nr:thioredoxin domain-containing protein [Aggregatilineaceae bacterium]